MRIILQRVTDARVSVDNVVVGEIGTGLVALVGITHSDTVADAARLADKTVAARVFANGDRPFDLPIGSVGGSVLCVSQFTLYGDIRRGNRPSWTDAAGPDQARAVIDAYVARMRHHNITVATGVFGAHMQVQLKNDGPVTLILESAELSRPRREVGSPAGAG
jgi:D-tyrosyl-tRNA(Tyr) deacylase